MHIFNPNYKLPQNAESLERLARLKRAADRVYVYFEWLSSDYRNRDNKDLHNEQIETLRTDVKLRLYLNDSQDPLVNYFIACTLFAIQTSLEEDSPRGTPTPIDRSLLESMYDAAKVAELLCDAPIILISYSTGTFLLADTADPANLASIELARKGSLVMADQELVETVALATLMGLDEADNFTDSEEGELFLRELRRVDEMVSGFAPLS